MVTRGAGSRPGLAALALPLAVDVCAAAAPASGEPRDIQGLDGTVTSAEVEGGVADVPEELRLDFESWLEVLAGHREGEETR